MWIAILNVNNDLRQVDWAANYKRVRQALTIEEPGYAIHEAVEWSSVHKKWLHLPHRLSKYAFDEKEDGHLSAYNLIIANEGIEHINVVTIGDCNTSERRFSSFKFLPNSNDNVIVAMKRVKLKGQ